MKLSEIFGKSISYYDEFNGDRKSVKISCISSTEDNKHICFSGMGRWGKEIKIYVPIEVVDYLITSRVASTAHEIDHCTCLTTWTIFDTL